MRAAFGSIKLFSCFFFFWMVLGVPGFCPLRGAAGVEGTWRGCALQVTVASPQSRRGCEGHLSQSPLWDVRRGACRGMVVVTPSELALGQGRVAPSLVLFCCCSPCGLGKSSAGSEPSPHILPHRIPRAGHSSPHRLTAHVLPLSSPTSRNPDGDAGAKDGWTDPNTNSSADPETSASRLSSFMHVILHARKNDKSK